MKKSLFFLICASFALLQGAGVPDSEIRPARYIRTDAKKSITATAANARIVIDAKASSTVKFAAKELQYFLSEIFGRKIAIVNTVTPGKVSFILGDNAWSRKAGVDFKKLCREGFIIKSAGNCVYIAGIDDPKANAFSAVKNGGAATLRFDRGTVMGVYDFLERFAGVRMYFPGEMGTIIPKKAALKLPAIDIFDRPDYNIRRVYTWHDGEWFEKITPAKRLELKNLNLFRLRMGSNNYIVCHGLNHFKYIKRFGKSNPEYFAISSNGTRSNVEGSHFAGQLCFNSGVTEEIYQDVRSFFKGEPASKRKILNYRGTAYGWGPNVNVSSNIIDVMPQDSMEGCRCPKCLPLVSTKSKNPQYATDFIWNHVISWANRLKKEGLDGKLGMMSYTPYGGIPAAKVPDNIKVQVATGGPWYKSSLETDKKRLKAWGKKLNHKVFLWNYINVGFSIRIYDVPYMTPVAMGDYYKAVSPWVDGAFGESEGKHFLFHYLNYYILSRVTWDTKADHRAILKEHYLLMFGKGAPFMEEIYTTFERKWLKEIAGRTVDTALGPVTSVPSDYDLWNKVYSPAELKRLKGLFDKALKAVPKNSMESKRIAFMEKNLYAPMVRASEAYRAYSNAVRGFKFYAEKGGELFLRPLLLNNRTKKKTTVTTGVKFAVDKENLVVTFRCEEPRLADLLAVKRKHDDIEVWKDNGIELFLNPSCDRKTFYQIIINSNGDFFDQKEISWGGKKVGTPAWESGAKVKITKGKNEWTAVVTLPLKNLPGFKGQLVGNFCRNRILKSGNDYEQYYCWGPFVKGFHDVENFGTVTFEKDRNILVNSDFSLPKTPNGNYGLYLNGKWAGGWHSSKKIKLDFDNFVSAPCSMQIFGKDPLVAQTIYKKLIPGKKYRLSFFVKTENVVISKRSGGVCANFANMGNNWYPVRKPSGTLPWIFHETVYTAKPQTKGNPYLWMRILYGTGKAWFDDVRLEELP